jgi:hypothetical protein
MKKKFLVYCLFIFLGTSFFVGYSKNDDSAQFGKSFIRTYYTINDYTKLNNPNTLEGITQEINNISKTFKNIMDENTLKNDIANKYQMVLHSTAYISKFNINVKDIKLTKKQTGSDNSTYYDYTAVLNLIFESKRDTQTISGQIAVKKINNKWDITTNWLGNDFFMMIKKYQSNIKK